MVEELRKKFNANLFEFTKHAVDRTLLRKIAVDEIREAISTATIIEDYLNDKYGPSCLVLGFTSADRPLHVQCSYPSRPIVKIITVYEPDPTDWIEFRFRRV